MHTNFSTKEKKMGHNYEDFSPLHPTSIKYSSNRVSTGGVRTAGQGMVEGLETSGATSVNIQDLAMVSY
ncbi:hypothetical protein E2C01_044814 [Portunus trituberculatus]|uniref:Uncharacterized protein n=1 Tax=Portunus trituberculatus TaxID=210409 RepID=A0A5B7G0H6_PORTR|nr:hypothetical protein [Portunus trituberculatus]